MNLDVLLHIMSMSNLCEASRLMRASRELHSEGPKYLLGGVVELQRISSVLSFVAFMRADRPHRFQFLQQLAICTGRLFRSQAVVLKSFIIEFEPLLEIRKLTIDCAEQFFKSCAGLGDAFALLRQVKFLTLTGIGRRTNLFLMSSRSSLLEAELAMIPEDEESVSSDGEDEDDDDDGDFRNPVLQLHQFQETLRSLRVHYCDTFSDTGSLYPHVYPNVDELVLTANELPITVHYGLAFPNLKTLRMTCDTREFDTLGDDFDAFHNYRRTNKIRQLQHGGWPALQAVHGTLTDHYLLGLMCPVAELHFQRGLMEERMFRSVLTTTRPQYVNLYGFDVGLFVDGAFARLVRGRPLVPVRAFDIFIIFGGTLGPEQVAFPKALDALIEGIATMPSLRSFGLTLCGLGLVPGPHDYRWRFRRTENHYPAEEYLRDLDLDALACRIRQEVLSLQTVAVTLMGHRTRPNASATHGEDVVYEEGAVERLPLLHASTFARMEFKTVPW